MNNIKVVMKNLILVLAFTAIITDGFAQNNPKLDSLLNAIKKYDADKEESGRMSFSQNDSVKTNMEDRLGELYLKQSKFSEALQNFESALRIQKAIRDKNGMAISLTNLGRLNETMNVFQPALDYDLSALETRKAIGNTLDIAKAYDFVAQDYENLRQNRMALENYDNALKNYLHTTDLSRTAKCYHNIGRVYVMIKNTDKALESEHKGLRIAEEIGDSVLEKRINNSIKEINKK